MNDQKSVLEKLLTTLNPLATINGTIDIEGLPSFTKGQDIATDKLIYNSLGSIVSLGTLSALATAVAHRVRKRKWDKKQKSIVNSSVNSLYPISIPNTVKNTQEEVEDARKVASHIAKEANDNDHRDLLERIKDSFIGAIPVASGLTTVALMPALINKRLKDTDEETLDREIAERYNRLDALHAEAINLGLAKKASDPLLTAAGSSLGAFMALLGPVAGITFYHHLKKTDKNQKIVDTMEDLAAENLTNIPQRISLKLSDNGTPVKTRKEQKALENNDQVKAKTDSNKDKEEPKKLENKETDKVEEKEKNKEKEDLFS